MALNRSANEDNQNKFIPAKRATQNASKKVKIVENGASLNHPLIY